MAASAASFLSLCPPVSHIRTSRFPYSRYEKPLRISCVSSSIDSSNPSAVLEKPSLQSKSGNWQWRFQDNSINVFYEEYKGENDGNAKNILMIPTISDVSTVEEWRMVAKDIVTRNGEGNWHATIVDWPGLGFSDRPSLDYNADVMEKFVIQFMNAPDSPLMQSGENTN